MAALLRCPRQAVLAASSCLLVMLSGPAAGADGLSLADSGTGWPRWQARLSMSDVPAARWGLVDNVDWQAPVRAALLGDFDLGNFGLALPFASGRFRATSGLLFGLRYATAAGWNSLSAVESSVPSAPYLGLGYTGWVPKTGLSFSADIGFSADYPGGSWRFGRALFGNQGVDATLRELRLQPRLQFGVQFSY